MYHLFYTALVILSSHLGYFNFTAMAWIVEFELPSFTDSKDMIGAENL